MSKQPATGSPSPDSDRAAPPAGKAGRDLPAAIGVGVGIGAVVLLTLFVYRPAFGALVLLVVGIACYEISTALRSRGFLVAWWPLVVGGAAMGASAWFYGLDGLAVATLLTFLVATGWRMTGDVEGFVSSTAASALVILYVPFLAGFAVMMANRESGAVWVITWALAVVCNDTGGYTAGVLIGKHPMAPTISPKKSWEGFGGSLLAAAIASVLMFTLALDGQWWHGALFGLAIAMIATVGDLAESMIKRDLGIKDMSNLLPGHGGVMDRLDSLLFSAPLAWMLLTLFVG
ncbi:phosphatidate cytidylyltransferase [Cumulibacter soli]|uniref:phosphatidate cytidylyltransferase n=1 Tax=Cumulibacter soli TaxID=2546344 RepID=UPI0010689B32|nr:phosphatidate cytidylyltransferase [Cumulibacter soli]